MENSLSLYQDQCSQVYYGLPISLESYHISQMNSLSPSILKNRNKTKFDKETKLNFKECSMTKASLRTNTQKNCVFPTPKNLAAPLLYSQIFLISILLPKTVQLWHDPLPQDMPGNKYPAETQYMLFSLILVLS